MRKQKLQAEQASLNQIQALQQQISESERNLKLQHDVLMQEQQVKKIIQNKKKTFLLFFL